MEPRIPVSAGRSVGDPGLRQAVHPRPGQPGSAASLEEVVAHYEVLGLGLTEEQAFDLVEYLRSL